MLHAIYFTDPWDRGMGWTVRYSCVSERDRWTVRGMSHDPMGLWDGMDSRTHASVEGQVDILWKVPWGCGIGWTIPCNPMGPWDGMDNLRHFSSPFQQNCSYLTIHCPIVKSRREYKVSLGLVYPPVNK